jgi:hypothetical protein
MPNGSVNAAQTMTRHRHADRARDPGGADAGECGDLGGGPLVDGGVRERVVEAGAAGLAGKGF